nr:hypothetical protein [Tanacetum cinerariifolium]
MGKESVADKAVYKELDDSLVRAATTASSLEAKQDSGGGPRCQEAMRDTIAQTRSERVFKLSNDLLLARARVKSSDYNEDLDEDTSKQGRISDIDANEDITLVSIYDDTEMIDADKDLHELKHIKPKAKAKGIVFHEPEESTIATTATIPKLKSQDKGKAIMIVEPVKLKKKHLIMLDEEVALKLQVKLQAEFDKEQRLEKKRRKFYASKATEEKRIKPPTQAQKIKIMCTYLKNMEEKKLKDLKNKSFDSIQKIFHKAFKIVNTFKPISSKLVEGSLKRAGTELEQESSKRAETKLEQESFNKQKIDDDKETTELKQLVKIIPNKEGVAIDAIPLAVKPPGIVVWKIHKEGKKSYYRIIRADGMLLVNFKDNMFSSYYCWYKGHMICEILVLDNKDLDNVEQQQQVLIGDIFKSVSTGEESSMAGTVRIMTVVSLYGPFKMHFLKASPFGLVSMYPKKRDCHCAYLPVASIGGRSLDLLYHHC